MAVKRSWLNCRLKNRVAIFGFTIIIISSLLVYRALSSSYMVRRKPAPYSIPSFDDRNPRGEHKLLQENIPDVNKPFQNIGFIPPNLESVRDRDLLSADSKEALTNFLHQLYPTNWATAPDVDELTLELKYLLIDYGFESKLSCKEIDSWRLGNPISFSNAKYIEYAYKSLEETRRRNYNEEPPRNTYNYESKFRQPEAGLAVKSPSTDTYTKIACMKQVYDSDLCAAVGSYRMLREVLLSSTLQHPCIIQMKGYCLRGSRVASQLQRKGIILVAEVGTPMSQMIIDSLSWSQRIAIALQIGRLLLYFESSPFGSLHFRKLDLKDFVLVDGKVIKLTDLDDLEMGEKVCRDESHCQLEGLDKGVPCVGGFCDGLSALGNLNLAVKSVILPLLLNVNVIEIQNIVKKVENLELTTAEMAASLKIIFKNAPSVNEKHFEAHREKLSREKHIRFHDKAERGRENRVGLIPKDERAIGTAISHFIRYEKKNFAGLYDYSCPGSRVSWGCVLTVTNLTDAAVMCLEDPRCRCFVTFTNEPDRNRAMTIILKNSTNQEPDYSSSTTLYVRESNAETLVPIKVKEAEIAMESKSPIEVHDCLDRTLELQKSARSSREKRLMAHLGLKDVQEQAWRRSALKQTMKGQTNLVRERSGAGGRFIANLTKRLLDDPEEIAKNVLFISEDGPRVYHLAYALVYHIDRTLGLYHTPPCVGKLLSAGTVSSYQSNPSWEETFKSMIESDGTLPGIVVVPTPKVMKVGKLNLTSLKAMTSKIVPFSRQTKLHLEYIVLWWLGNMNKTDRSHLGYKGHLIHFFADKAFTNTELDLSGYLYHCQFPNVVFKTLGCFRCESKDEVGGYKPSICLLGEEVIKRTQSMFSDEMEIFIHNLREGGIKEAIDIAATSIYQIVDACIKKFGRENVLY